MNRRIIISVMLLFVTSLPVFGAQTEKVEVDNDLELTAYQQSYIMSHPDSQILIEDGLINQQFALYDPVLKEINEVKNTTMFGHNLYAGLIVSFLIFFSILSNLRIKKLINANNK